MPGSPLPGATVPGAAAPPARDGDPVRILAGVGKAVAGTPAAGTHFAGTLDEHDRQHGPLMSAYDRWSAAREILETVEASGLLGRGGAAFPLSRKLRAVAAERGPAVVVANGAEGEPASAKDRVLLTVRPHLVLDGAMVAALAVGADRVIVASRNSAIDAVRTAIAERVAAGRDPIGIELAAMPDRFVAGQETAVVSRLNGGIGLPTLVPPRLSARGVDRRPTLVSNVETLAHLALVARHGSDWFRSVGTRREPGSTLLTVRGAVKRPGVYEVARGGALSDVLLMAGGATGLPGPVLVGGYAGAWLTERAVPSARLDEAYLVSVGAALGAGVVVAFDGRDCGLDITAEILAYLAAETAGQCGPCVHGLAAMAAAMQDLARGKCRRDAVQRLESWAWQVSGRGACRHPDGAARLAASALHVFDEDVAQHLRGRPCAGSLSPSWHPDALPAVRHPGRRVRE